MPAGKGFKKIEMLIRAEFDCLCGKPKFQDYDKVEANTVILEIECMKMLINVNTFCGGTIKYHCKEGDYLTAGQIIAEVI